MRYTRPCSVSFPLHVCVVIVDNFKGKLWTLTGPTYPLNSKPTVGGSNGIYLPDYCVAYHNFLAGRKAMSRDSRGVQRGRCTVCALCVQYRSTKGVRCERCGHPPGKHQNLDIPISSGAGTKCKGCTKEAYFEPGVGYFDYCTPECRDKALDQLKKIHADPSSGVYL